MAQDIWTLPTFNTFKLNFDGASRQNPGMAGYGGVVRDHTGAIHLIYHGNLGVNTNNAAELIALLQGLTLANRYRLTPLIVEGDSEIIIRMIRKLQMGAQVHRVTPSWRLSAILNDLQNQLCNRSGITFQAVRRKANKLHWQTQGLTPTWQSITASGMIRWREKSKPNAMISNKRI